MDFFHNKGIFAKVRMNNVFKYQGIRKNIALSFNFSTAET